MEHGLQCLARLIRILLGPSAVADGKMACGKSLDILGIDIRLSRKGFKCTPQSRKVQKWMQKIRSALEAEKLTPGDASKLAGKLSWGSISMFR